MRASLGLPLARPPVHMNVYCAETESEARRNAELYILQYADIQPRGADRRTSSPS